MNKRAIAAAVLVFMTLGSLGLIIAFSYLRYQDELEEGRKLPFPLNAEPVVGFRLYSVPGVGTSPKENAPELHGWKMVGDGIPISNELASAARTILSSPSTYTGHDQRCFEPGMAITFGQGANQIDVLICLFCDRVVFYKGDEQVGHVLTKEGHEKLKTIYEQVFREPLPKI